MTSLLTRGEGANGDTIAVVHFAGHGMFGADTADTSCILLEDGSLSVLEVGNESVKLGERYRPLVVFNACEVGATGPVLGAAGGRAEAFIRRQFGAFVAPLWSVIDSDAVTVLSELIDAIWNQHLPVGTALWQIRARYGATSPTFFAYLLYGDVNARVVPTPATKPTTTSATLATTAG